MNRNPYKINGKQISPCIVDKAKFALRIKHKQPDNKKTCSDFYWYNVVGALGKEHSLGVNIIETAKAMRWLYRPTK